MNHGWTIDTMDKCARVHMDQLIEKYQNLSDGKEKDKEIRRIISSYIKIDSDVVYNDRRRA